MPKTVMVTGANGHVGSNLTRELSRRGYHVRASVRDIRDTSKTAHPAEAGAREVVGLDVRDVDNFSSVSRGIDILFHCAATYRYYTGSTDADAEMTRDSIEGASAAIRAAHANRIGKVVMTSSSVTLPLVDRGGAAVTEENWRTDLRVPYMRAKVLAEKEAWKLAQELGVELVTVLPGAIIGPGFLRRTTSTDTIEGIMLGGMRIGAPNANLPLVDVRDVVCGHIMAAERQCRGRFSLVNDRHTSFLEITRIMHAIDHSIPVAPRILPDFVMRGGTFFDWLNAKTLGAPRVLTGPVIQSLLGKEWAVSNARAKEELGWRPEISVEQSLADTISTLRSLRATQGLLARPS